MNKEEEEEDGSLRTLVFMFQSKSPSELLNIKVRPFKLLIDNKSAIALSKNPSQHGRSKHIETKFHFIRDCVEKGYVDIEYVRTESQLADSFTKSLGCIKFEEIREKLGVAMMN